MVSLAECSSANRELLGMYIISGYSTTPFSNDDMKHYDLLDERENPPRMVSLYHYALRGHGGVKNKFMKEGLLAYVPNQKGVYRLTAAGLSYCARMWADILSSSNA